MSPSESGKCKTKARRRLTEVSLVQDAGEKWEH